MSDLFGKFEDWCSRDAAHFKEITAHLKKACLQVYDARTCSLVMLFSLNNLAQLFFLKMSGVTVASIVEFQTRSRGYKTFFMLNSAETKIYPAHKC